ncbi:MAG TPA: radical SAM protein [Methanomassiliicoccales archaeon]|nr:radical SAM protein [Methanomassiliicoccales archaeon]
MALDFTYRYVDRLADKIAASVEFSKVTRLEDVLPAKLERTGLNIRVPFCAAKCSYCAFPGESYKDEFGKAFLDAVNEELALYATNVEIKEVDRVYISGGTPSLMHKEMGQLLDIVRSHFEFSGKVAMEAGPGDLNEEVLGNFVASGVKQISVGVQTFDERMLPYLGRMTKRQQLIDVLGKVMDAGFDYVNIDLMFSLPTQTKEGLLADIELASDLGVDGVSTYPLMLLHYTPLTKKAADQFPQDPKEERDQYLAIIESMRAHGYKMRTLWSFSKRPEEYEGPYEHSNFVGIGPRAWGMVGGRFTVNAPSTLNYIQRLSEGFVPLFAHAPVKDFGMAKLARRMYYGKVTNAELETIESEEPKVAPMISLLRMLGLMEKTEDGIVLTDKALWLGSHATKKIAMSTLEKMNNILKETNEEVPEQHQLSQEFVTVS